MIVDKTMRDVYRMLATGGPSWEVDSALERTARSLAARRRFSRQFAIPLALAASAVLLTISGPLIKGFPRSELGQPLASTFGCEGASPRIYPALSAGTDIEQQGNGSAFLPIGAGSDPAVAPFECIQQRETP